MSGQTHQFAKELPYNAFVEITGNLVAQTERLEKKGERSSQIRKAAGAHGPILAKIFPPIREILGDIQGQKEFNPKEERLRLIEAVSAFLIHLAQAWKPMVIFLDDLQWADAGTFECLRELAAGIQNVPLVILCGYRTEEVDDRHPLAQWMDELKQKGWSGAALTLSPFGPAKTTSFCAEMLGSSPEEIGAAAKEIWERSHGNPFFIQELVKSYVSEGILSIEENRWRYYPDRAKQVLTTASIAETVLRRVRHLSAGAQRLLGYASLLGREFTLEKLKTITDSTPDEVLNALDEGIQKHLLWVNPALRESGYTFIHDRVHEVFYNTFAPEERQRRHLQIAEYFEKAAPADLFTIAHHYSESGNPEKTKKYCRLAGDQAKAALAHDKAIHFYQRALDNLPEGAETADALYLKENLADLSAWRGHYPEAIRLYKELRRHKKTEEAEALLEGKMAAAYHGLGDMEKAVELYQTALAALGIRFAASEKAIPLLILKEFFYRMIHALFPFFRRLRRIPNTPILQEKLQMIFSGAHCAFFVSPPLSLIYMLRGLALAERAGMAGNKMLPHFLLEYAIPVACIPLFSISRRALLRARKTAEALEDPWGAASAKMLTGLVAYYQACREESTRLFLDSVQELTDLGDSWTTPIALYTLAQNYIRMGKFAEAEKRLNICLRITEKVRDTRAASFVHSQLAWLRCLQGKIKEAGKESRQALEEARRSKAPTMLQEALTQRARIFLQEGEPLQALPLLKEASDLIKKYSIRADYIGTTYNLTAAAFLPLWKKDPSQRRRLVRSLRRALIHGLFFRNHFPEACRLKAIYEWQRGRRQRALRFLSRGEATARKTENRFESALLLLLQGIIQEDPEKSEEGKRGLEEMGAAIPPEMAAQREAPEERRLLPKIELETLLEASRLISSELSLDSLLEKILDKTIQVLRAERGLLMLYEEGKLVPKVVRMAEGGTDREEAIKISMSVVQTVEKSKKGIVITDAQLDPQFKEEASVIRGALRSILAAPLLVGERLQGVLYIDNRMVANLYTEEDLKILSALSVQAAVSIENAKAFGAVEEQVHFRTQELQAANRKLEDLSNLKSQLASITSHDLRGPISVLKLALYRMEKELGDRLSPDQRRLIQIGYESVSKMMAIIDELLNFNLLEAGKLKLNKQTANIYEVVEEELNLLKESCAQRHLALIPPSNPHPLKISIDRSRIIQVLDNLVRNAMKHTPEKGRITVEVGENPNEIILSVRDTGPGIPKQYLARLFEQFSKFGTKEGVGLGLFISKKFVEMHGGKIWVESDPGRGASFYFSLPRHN